MYVLSEYIPTKYFFMTKGTMITVQWRTMADATLDQIRVNTAGDTSRQQMPSWWDTCMGRTPRWSAAFCQCPYPKLIWKKHQTSPAGEQYWRQKKMTTEGQICDLRFSFAIAISLGERLSKV